MRWAFFLEKTPQRYAFFSFIEHENLTFLLFYPFLRGQKADFCHVIHAAGDTSCTTDHTDYLLKKTRNRHVTIVTIVTTVTCLLEALVAIHTLKKRGKEEALECKDETKAILIG